MGPCFDGTWGAPVGICFEGAEGIIFEGTWGVVFAGACGVPLPGAWAVCAEAVENQPHAAAAAITPNVRRNIDALSSVFGN